MENIKQNTIVKPYRFGKNIYAELCISGEAFNGKTILYAHPLGNLVVMSEDTLQKKLDLAIAEREKEIVEMIDNEIKEWNKGTFHTNIAGGAISALRSLKNNLINSKK